MSGFQMPVQACHFMVIHSGIGSNFSENAESAHIDFVNRRLKVQIRQTVVFETIDSVMTIRDERFGPRVEVLSPCGESIFTLHFLGTKLEKHDLNFSYGNSKPAIHDLEWSFSSVSAIPRRSDAPDDTHEFVSDPDFPTPKEALAKLLAEKNTD